MIFRFAAEKATERSLSTSNGRFPSTGLSDREAETFKKWLLAHPGVEIISRDRGGAFARSERGREPHRLEPIADRWHLLANLSETMKGFFLTKQSLLKSLVQKPSENVSEEEASQLSPWYSGTNLSKRKAREEHATASGASRTLLQDP